MKEVRVLVNGKRKIRMIYLFKVEKRQRLSNEWHEEINSNMMKLREPELLKKRGEEGKRKIWMTFWLKERKQ